MDSPTTLMSSASVASTSALCIASCRGLISPIFCGRLLFALLSVSSTCLKSPWYLRFNWSIAAAAVVVVVVVVHAVA